MAFSKKLLFLLLIFMMQIVIESRATHLVGGEIYYEYQGNDTYFITLVVYRDCGPANVNQTGFDPAASIGVFNASTNFLFTSVNVPLLQQNVEFVPVELENPCFILPPDLCVQKATYTTTIEVPPSEDGFYFAYQRCCRNPSISNLIAPDDTGITLRTDIPSTTILPEGNNSSASFNNFPPVALCAGAEFFFDHSASDTDGDSLVYEFCEPLHGATPDNPAPQPPFAGPYVNVTWDNPYTSSYQIASNPAFAIDSETGLITGTASQVGQFVIGVCVSEFRDGVLINISNRDFQFNVTLCDPNIIASIPEQTSYCDGLTVTFDNISTNASFFSWDFGVPGVDTDVSTSANPTFTFPEAGLYTVRLIANPGWTCADTAFSVFDARPPLEVEIFVGDATCDFPTVKYDFSAVTNGTNNALFTWDFGPGSQPQASSLQNPQNISLPQEALGYMITVTVEDNECFANDTIDLINPPEPVASIVPQESFCAGLTYTFEHTSSNAETYQWDFNLNNVGGLSQEESPTYTFPGEGSFTIQLIAFAEATCPDTTQMVFDIFDLLDPFFEPPSPQCLTGNSFDFSGTGNSEPNAEFSWTFGDGQSSNLQNPQNISYNQNGTYEVTFTISENGCTKNYTDEVWVAIEPEFTPVIHPLEGCAPHQITYSTNEIADSEMYYDWTFGDGNTSNMSSGSHTYAFGGSYDITVHGYTTEGCIDEITYTLPNHVTVFNRPIASFEIEDGEPDILNPEVTFINTSIDAISCVYYFGDGGSSTDCNPTHSFGSAGYQTVTLVVVNENGCYDQTQGRVFINGFLFYAPNSFSPNGDGINDYWLPVMTGVSAYQCTIYDRWGTVIFESTDPDEAWIGNVRGGEHYAENGIYQYDVVFNDSAGLSRRNQGHICLFR